MQLEWAPRFRPNAHPAYLAMVSLRGFLLELLPLFHLFRVGKRDGVDSLEAFHIGLAFPIRRRILGDLECFDFAGVSDVRSSAKIDQRPAAVSRCLIRLNFLLDDALLEWIMREKIEQLLFSEDATLEGLLFF